MNKDDFISLCREDLEKSTGDDKQCALQILAENYLADPDLHSPEASALLLAETLKQDTLLAETALEKYQRHTRPRFFLPVAGACALVIGAFIQIAPFGGKGPWMVLLVLLMLYVSLRMLPNWRKRLPQLREAVKRLAENAIDAAGDGDPQPHWKHAVGNRLMIQSILAEALYRNPFPYWADALLKQATTDGE